MTSLKNVIIASVNTFILNYNEAAYASFYLFRVFLTLRLSRFAVHEWFRE